MLSPVSIQNREIKDKEGGEYLTLPMGLFLLPVGLVPTGRSLGEGMSVLLTRNMWGNPNRGCPVRAVTAGTFHDGCSTELSFHDGHTSCLPEGYARGRASRCKVLSHVLSQPRGFSSQDPVTFPGALLWTIEPSTCQTKDNSREAPMLRKWVTLTTG